MFESKPDFARLFHETAYHPPQATSEWGTNVHKTLNKTDDTSVLTRALQCLSNCKNHTEFVSYYTILSFGWAIATGMQRILIWLPGCIARGQRKRLIDMFRTV